MAAEHARAMRLVASIACFYAAMASAPATAGDVFPDTVFGNGFEPCTGFECAQVACAGGGTTSVSGTVYAPNGTLPLPNVEVYVPNSSVDAFVDGASAPRCDLAQPGHPIAATLTDVNGNFTLKNVPATSAVPLVVVAGKWRRQLTIANVPQCTNTPLATTDTRLPKSHLEGDIPHIAVTTGSADSIECVLRKTGVLDSEFGASSSSARIHLFTGSGVSKIDGGATLTDATTLWSSLDSLSAYDQVMLGCEGSQNPATKPETSILALKAYVDAGGRAYLAHWHNIWIAGENGNPSHAGAWPAIATWDLVGGNFSSTITGLVNATFPQGAKLSSWLYQVGASTTMGSLPINQGRQTAITIDTSVAQSWIYLTTTSLNEPSVQYFTFTTPTDLAAGAQKGRVLFTDMHGGSDSSPAGGSFPSGGCKSSVGAITPQEKALVYATFDLQRCVGSTRE